MEFCLARFAFSISCWSLAFCSSVCRACLCSADSPTLHLELPEVELPGLLFPIHREVPVQDFVKSLCFLADKKLITSLPSTRSFATQESINPCKRHHGVSIGSGNHVARFHDQPIFQPEDAFQFLAVQHYPDIQPVRFHIADWYEALC